MWTRAELKSRAKASLSRYYGPALLVSFIANLFSSQGNGGSSTGGAAAGVNTGTGITSELIGQIPGVEAEKLEEMLEGVLEGVPGAMDALIGSIDPLALSVAASIAVVALVIGLVFSVFVAPLFEVGRNRFYMESRASGYSVGVQKILWGFTHDYLNIVWTMFLRNMIVFLGTICGVLPGIYFGYCYYMVPYILAENPDMKAGDVLRMSKDMMEGHKINTFVLGFSFWGWWILGSLLCGVGGILVQPYYDATFAELYAVLRQRFRYNLNGFGHYEHNDDYYSNGGGADVTQQPYASSSERNEYAGPGQESSSQRNAESGRYADYGYYQGTGTENRSDNQNSSVVREERTQEVKRSEGGPGRGYYLNGVFYPYTDDELRELEENKYKN